MPAWMTSLLRELVTVPKVGAESRTKTSLPLKANSLAIAIPTIPAPITTQSTVSFAAELISQLWIKALISLLKNFVADDDDDFWVGFWICRFLVKGNRKFLNKDLGIMFLMCDFCMKRFFGELEVLSQYHAAKVLRKHCFGQWHFFNGVMLRITRGIHSDYRVSFELGILGWF